MLALRIALGLALAYALLVLLAWRFQERLAFPAPRAPVPDPKRVGVANGEKVELVSGDGTKLVGWYLTPKVAEVGGGLLWFYGNGAKDRKSTRLNSSHSQISYAVFCLKKKKN